MMLPWLQLWCYHGYSYDITMVTAVMSPWLQLWCYHGYSYDVTMYGYSYDFTMVSNYHSYYT